MVGGSGGRIWWAHIEFTRMNIERTFQKERIEDLREKCVDVDCRPEHRAIGAFGSNAYDAAASHLAAYYWRKASMAHFRLQKTAGEVLPRK
jgi:hypothetical protein